jgi:hypothetical protein
VLYQGCWLVICKQAVEDMRIFAAAMREKYENMVFIRQDGEFRLGDLVTCKEGLLLSSMNAFPTSRKTVAVGFFLSDILLNFF